VTVDLPRRPSEAVLCRPEATTPPASYLRHGPTRPCCASPAC